MVCEHKTVVFDLLTKQSTEVTKAALEGKAATCVSVMYLGGQAMPAGDPSGVMRRPALAFGCSDGVVRVLQFGTFQVRVQRCGQTERVVRVSSARAGAAGVQQSNAAALLPVTARS